MIFVLGKALAGTARELADVFSRTLTSFSSHPSTFLSPAQAQEWQCMPMRVLSHRLGSAWSLLFARIYTRCSPHLNLVICSAGLLTAPSHQLKYWKYKELSTCLFQGGLSKGKYDLVGCTHPLHITTSYTRPHTTSQMIYGCTVVKPFAH